jgi:hypothetical protein
LTELVAIGHMRECPKYQIRTHYVFLLRELAARPVLLGAAGAAGEPTQSRATPNSCFQGLDARHWRLVQYLDAILHTKEQASYRIVTLIAALGFTVSGFPIPGMFQNAQVHQQ